MDPEKLTDPVTHSRRQTKLAKTMEMARSRNEGVGLIECAKGHHCDESSNTYLIGQMITYMVSLGAQVGVQ